MLAGDAYACACIAAPIEERLEDADAAVIGRIVSEEEWILTGRASARLLTIAVEQRVKGDLGDTVFVRVPSGTDCDVDLELEKTTGLLLTRVREGPTFVWFASLCSVVTPGELVAAGGEPRGGVIKVVLGVLILGLVLSWALRRKARGTRPDLPGAPKP